MFNPKDTINAHMSKLVHIISNSVRADSTSLRHTAHHFLTKHNPLQKDTSLSRGTKINYNGAAYLNHRGILNICLYCQGLFVTGLNPLTMIVFSS